MYACACPTVSIGVLPVVELHFAILFLRKPTHLSDVLVGVLRLCVGCLGMCWYGLGAAKLAGWGGACSILRLRSSDAMVTVIAGNGSEVAGGDGGLAVNAGVPAPTDVSFDGQGNLYIASAYNTIRKVSRRRHRYVRVRPA